MNRNVSASTFVPPESISRRIVKPAKQSSLRFRLREGAGRSCGRIVWWNRVVESCGRIVDGHGSYTIGSVKSFACLEVAYLLPSIFSAATKMKHRGELLGE